LYAKLYSAHEPGRWECQTDILGTDILYIIGMPVIFNSVRYNCQVFCLNHKIIMIRPKMSLANDGNYQEFQWFSAWTFKDEIVDSQLPIDMVLKVLPVSMELDI
jgi:NAD+ synthase (glutamine-hydrolysing)